MNPAYNSRATVTVYAPPQRVWQALTDPAIIKQYFFGSDIVTDWHVGSPIYYRGEWQGKPYQDKGKVIAFEPNRRLVVTHWSPLSGTPDTPENYHTLTYTLEPSGSGTIVTLEQDNNNSEKEQQEFSNNWAMVLGGMKKVVEQNP